MILWVDWAVLLHVVSAGHWVTGRFKWPHSGCWMLVLVTGAQVMLSAGGLRLPPFGPPHVVARGSVGFNKEHPKRATPTCKFIKTPLHYACLLMSQLPKPVTWLSPLST